MVPFVPLGTTPMELCIRTAREFGARAAAELNLPVYFYEEAATRPERRSLRAGARRRLRGAATHPADRRARPRPRPCPHAPHRRRCRRRRAGPAPRLQRQPALRRPGDRPRHRPRHPGARRRPARHPRARAARFPPGVTCRSRSTSPSRTGCPLYRVLELVRAEARRWDVAVSGTELIGTLRLSDLVETARYSLGLHDLRESQVLDTWLAE